MTRCALVLLLVAAVAPIHGRVQTGPADFFAALQWRCIGPFEGGPVSAVWGVAGVPGVYTITTPTGGSWKTSDGGQTWASVDGEQGPPTIGDPLRWIDPANPTRIARVEQSGIAVSLDAGSTWTSWHNQPIAQIDRIDATDTTVAPITPAMIAGQRVRVIRADVVHAGLVFAGTDESVDVSFDAGGHWESLRLNLPRVSVRDLAIHGNDLVAATYGRSLWVLDDITPLRQMAAAMPVLAVVLFKPADVARVQAMRGADDPVAAEVHIDYFLRDSPAGDVRLDIRDAAGRVVHTASSRAPTSDDPWRYPAAPLPATPGAHRVLWDVRLDPPPAEAHRYARLASALRADSPPDPEGPLVLPGLYQVILTVMGKSYTQPLTVRRDPRIGASGTAAAAATTTLQRQFDLADQAYEAMATAHAGFTQLTRVRAQLKPFIAASDIDLAQAAADLDVRLADLDGSDANGLLLPDADNGLDEGVEDKDHDLPVEAKPVPVSLTKDYDDPTMIIGRAFENANHAPAFAIVNMQLAALLTRTEAGDIAPSSAETADYQRSCETLASALATWQGIVTSDLPQFNRELTKRKLAPLLFAATVPAARVCK